MKLPFKNRKEMEMKVSGKTFTFSKEERELIERHLGLINIQKTILNSLGNEIERIKMVAKNRVGLDPYTHVQVNYEKGTFFVPDVKPAPSTVQPEVKKEEK